MLPSINKKVNLLILLISLLSCQLFSQKPKENTDDHQRKLTRKIRDFKNRDSALSYANELHARADKLNDQKWKAQIFLAQSYYSYGLGDIADALELAKQATSIAVPVDSVTYVKSPLMVAYMLNRQGKDNEALKIAFATLKKTEQKGWKAMSFESNNCIADVYRTMKLSSKALIYAKQAYNLSKELKDTASYLAAISTLSNIYSNRDIRTPKNLAEATRLYEIVVSEPYFSTFSDFSKARHLSNMGRLYIMEEKQDKAEEVLKHSIAISGKGKFKNLESSALNELMTLKMNQKRYAEAMLYGHRAIQLVEQEGDVSTLKRDIYSHLTEGYAQLEDFEKAYKYSVKEKSISDSLMATEKSELAAKMDQEYKADKHILSSDANARLMRQQRNFILTLGIIAIAVLILVYLWFIAKRRKKEALIEAERKQLEKLNALKTKFFANISHELRTPLTLIVGPVDQLRNDTQQLIPVETKQIHIETIWQNSRKLTRLVNELLDLNKLESTALSLYLQEVNLSDFMHVVYQGFSSAADFKKVNYQLDCGIEPKLVTKLDKDKLEKVLNNLISNALKFTPGKGSVAVRATTNSSGLVITIADTGRGIPQKDLDFVFDRYYQVQSDHNVAEGGTGIGLSIAKEYTELMGGKIWIKSVVNQGSVFGISLPLSFEQRIVADDVVKSISDPRVQDLNSLNYGASGMILLVEDQIEMANYISSILSPYHQVRIVSNGVEALQTLAEMQVLPSLIVSDVMMPEMDGFKLLGKLKEHDSYCRIPVVMLTALADIDNKLSALNIGVDDYLTKPFLSAELLARSLNLINNSVARLQPVVEIESTLVSSPLPQEPSVSLSPADLKWLKKLEVIIQSDIRKVDFDLVNLSSTMAVSERQLHRNIKRITGLTPNKYIRAVRLQMAREAIESGKYRTLAEISYVAGFETPAYFSKLYKEEFGVSVSDRL
ncbi:MAG: response regulator [Pedobacter sp.]|nr:MAG: response regulator [Pedobacter sp.]